MTGHPHLTGFTDEEIATEYKNRRLKHDGTIRKRREPVVPGQVTKRCQRCKEKFTYIRKLGSGATRIRCDPCTPLAVREMARIAQNRRRSQLQTAQKLRREERRRRDSVTIIHEGDGPVPFPEPGEKDQNGPNSGA